MDHHQQNDPTRGTLSAFPDMLRPAGQRTSAVRAGNRHSTGIIRRSGRIRCHSHGCRLFRFRLNHDFAVNLGMGKPAGSLFEEKGFDDPDDDHQDATAGGGASDLSAQAFR